MTRWRDYVSTINFIDVNLQNGNINIIACCVVTAIQGYLIVPMRLNVIKFVTG